MLKCKVGAKSRMSLVNDILLILIRHGDVGVLRTLGERCLAANELEPVVQARMTVVGTVSYTGSAVRRFFGILRTVIWK